MYFHYTRHGRLVADKATNWTHPSAVCVVQEKGGKGLIMQIVSSTARWHLRKILRIFRIAILENLEIFFSTRRV